MEVDTVLATITAATAPTNSTNNTTPPPARKTKNNGSVIATPTAEENGRKRKSPAKSFGNHDSAKKKKQKSSSSASSTPALTPSKARSSSSSSMNMQDKTGKGLRHFSSKVCQKVEEKGVTTYNEVADELVKELTSNPDPDKRYDAKNIRRRVYDALNVLMAMDIIAKEKKEIKWCGLPTTASQELRELEREKKEREERVHKKKLHLQELLLQLISFQNLVKRNKEREENPITKPDPNNCVHLPFILVSTHPETRINCEMLEDRSQYYFDFDMPFEIHDDIEILRRLKLNYCTPTEVKNMVPTNIIKYLPPSMLGNSNELMQYEPQSIITSAPPDTSFDISSRGSDLPTTSSPIPSSDIYPSSPVNSEEDSDEDYDEEDD